MTVAAETAALVKPIAKINPHLALQSAGLKYLNKPVAISMVAA